uniref:Putative secreted protein n=1 Tax=Anopheles darlingi TaxID=43151 RepID=A0A2M4DGQ0_ANODA
MFKRCQKASRVSFLCSLVMCSTHDAAAVAAAAAARTAMHSKRHLRPFRVAWHCLWSDGSTPSVTYPVGERICR